MNGYVYSLEEMVAVITPILRKYKAEQAILFGSYARRRRMHNLTLICL